MTDSWGWICHQNLSLIRQIPDLPTGINERLMTWHITLSKERYITIISAYIPTLVASEQEKDNFYISLDICLQEIQHNDKVLLLAW